MNVNRGTEKQQKLPPGWRWAKLGDVCEVATGGTPNTGIAEYYGGNIAWMKSGDVKGTYIDDATHQISEEGLQNSNARVHPQGTVLLAMSGQGKTRGLSAILRIEAACSQSVAAILPNEYLLPEIIHYWLMAHYDDTRGITGDNERSGLNLRLVRNIFILLPPLSEQKRITAILNEQMAVVEKARAAAEAQFEAAKALPTAYLRQVFPKDGQQLPPGWRWAKLGDVCDSQIANKDLREAPEATFIYIDISSIDSKAKRILEARKLLCKEAPSRARQVIKEKDVIVSTTRPGLNAVAIISPELEGQICSTGFCVLRTRPDILIPELLFFFVQTPHFVSSLQDLVRGALYPAVTDSQVRDQLFPLPPRVEQKHIAAIINEQLASTERLRNDLEKQLREINALPAALLRRAFNGEL